MDEMYLRLGRTIARRCPSGFDKAVLSAAMDAPGGGLALSCVAEGEEERPVPLDESAKIDLRAALLDIRHVMTRQDGKAWRTCTVTLTKGGGFALDVGD